MVHALIIKDQEAYYCNNWVKTKRFKSEQSAGRPLYLKVGLGDV